MAPSPDPPSPRAGRWKERAIVWLIAWACGGLLLALGGAAVVAGGLFDATASAPHLPETAWAIHTTFIHAVERRAPHLDAPPPTAAQVQAGFGVYDQNCSFCHGGPGIPRARFVEGMNPTPPYIVDAARTWSTGELYWIVDRGAKMTAMPAWRGTLTHQQIMDVVAFLRALPYVSPQDYARLRAARQAQNGAPGR